MEGGMGDREKEGGTGDREQRGGRERGRPRRV